jgi:hypothetical protein
MHDTVRYRLPDKNISGSSLFCSSKAGYYPARIKPASTTVEKNVVGTLISELRSKLALDLDASPSYERGLALQAKAIQKSVEFLIVGSSNAERLMFELSNMGCNAGLAHQSNYRIFKGSSETLTTRMKAAITDLDPATIVYFLLDNSYYHTKYWDGSRGPPKKLEDGHYHVVGELHMEPRDMQRELLKELKPVLDLAGKRNAIIVTPMPRYWTRGCCGDPNHTTNRNSGSFKTDMVANLAAAKQLIKDNLFHEGRRNFKVVDPNVDISSLTEEEAWGQDPVHPLPLVYSKIAGAVVKLAASMRSNAGNKRRREDSQEAGPSRNSWRGQQGPGGPHRGGLGRGSGPSRGSGRGGGWYREGGRGGYRGHHIGQRFRGPRGHQY